MCIQAFGHASAVFLVPPVFFGELFFDGYFGFAKELSEKFP